MDFKQFLEVKYLEWQQKQGGRKTVHQFASYLGVGQSTLSNWWNGERKPEGESVDKLAKKLGLEVYDVLGLERPDPDLHYLQQVWYDLSDKERRTIREQVERYARENIEADHSKNIFKKRGT